MYLLAIFFFVTAILYSSVGFGGGSTYLALLLIWNVPYFILPVVALLCNIIVVSGNCFNYIRAGNFNFKLLAPYLAGSIPLAYFGGSLSIEIKVFEIILFYSYHRFFFHKQMVFLLVKYHAVLIYRVI